MFDFLAQCWVSMAGFRLGACLAADLDRESIVFGVWTLMQEPRCRLALYWESLARLCFCVGTSTRMHCP